jgi:signal transduction histidine kinase
MKRPGRGSSRRILTYVIPLLIVVLTLWGALSAQSLSWQLYNEPLHSTAEAVEALAVLLLALFLLSIKREGTEDRLTLPAVGFLGMGILNGFHAAAWAGDQFVLLRGAASLAGSLGFVLVWLPAAACRYVSHIKWLPWAVAAGSLAFGCWTFLFPGTLPVMVRNGEFTAAAIAINLAGGILFMAGALRFVQDFNHSGKAEYYLFFLIGLFFGLAGLTFKYSTLWSAECRLWHGLRLIASLLVLVFLARKHLQTFAMLEVAISEHKQAEKRVQQTLANLERSNRELEQFAFVVSHDLQEPLRVVASYVQLLEKKYKGVLDEKADLYIHFAVDGVSRMQKLIKELLAYSRITTSGNEFRPVDTNKMFDEAMANLSAAIEESHAVVTKDDLPTVSGDEIQLVQLMQNLIGNAIKFRRPDIPPLVHVSAKREWVEWVFSVRDNGIGIEPEFSDRIFLIFQRLHTRGDYPGTGIGLTLCKRIVERHHGRIWVESVPGAGSTFYFTVPVMPGKRL